MMNFIICAVRTSAFFFLATSFGGAIESLEQQRFFELKEWVKDIGGVAHDALLLGETSWGGRGLFVDMAVAKDETLVGIPFDYVIGHEFVGNKCEMVKDFEREAKLNDNSRLDVYIEMDDSLNSPLPGMWSNEEIAMLQNLPPSNPRGHFQWYLQTCLDKWLPTSSDYAKAFGELPIEERQALLATVTRVSDVGFIPIYDLVNHDNGDLNTYIEIDKQSEMAFMKALRDIKPGQEVTNSYGHMSTPNIFYTYGFIEPYPRVWEIVRPEKPSSPYLVALLSPNGPVLLDDEASGISLQRVMNPHGNIMELRNVSASGLLRRSSTSVLHDVLDAVTKMEALFPTTIKQDQEQLLTRSGHEKIAIEYRIEYKQAVHFIAETLENEIHARPTEVSSEL